MPETPDSSRDPVRPVKAPAGKREESEAKDPAARDDEIEFSAKAIAVVCGVLLLLALGLYVIGSGDDEESPGTSASPSQTTQPTGSTPPTSKKPKPPKQPVGGPAGEPTDAFDEADGPVGEPWTSVGSWGRAKGALVLLEAEEGKDQFLVREVGADGTVSAVAVFPTSSSALVFRYVDEQNYWMLRPALQYATWALVKVVDGEQTNVGDTDLSPTEQNTTVTVELAGPSIKVLVDGKELLAIEDDTHQSATKAGFTILVDRVTLSKWDRFFGIPAAG